MEKRVAALSNSEVEQIWITMQGAPNARAAAKTLGIHHYLVGFATRKHQKRLNSLPAAKKWAIWAAAQNGGYKAAAAEAGLDERSAAYIVREMHNPALVPGVDNTYIGMLLDWLKQDIEREPEKWGRWFRSDEFRTRQLRRKLNGEVVGEYSKLYYRLLACSQAPGVDPELAEQIRWFLKTADRTFADRRARQKAFLKQERERKRGKLKPRKTPCQQ